MAKSFAKESALAQTSMWPSNATFLDVIQKASTRGSAPDSLGTNVRLSVTVSEGTIISARWGLAADVARRRFG